ncbi:MAG TPA: Panacea domain-containing protein [Ramlibacter sp.]|uniref:Panacea domain-containing protein n=1 Tax=Ramlibacter sp. TaxID=1917967 RepID=UPI002CDC5DB9|nr:Panacea domain-containing protein [Ramlibacter sp.]HVZ46023.1 Panacea domain-containing protein [Ramlibacter sp.]
MFSDPYIEAKAAHSAAYFLKKAGGSLELLKLMKLMYLAERRCYAQYGRPMIGDRPMADRHGPVLDGVYRAAADENHRDGHAGPTWRSLILPRDGNDIVLRDPDPTLKKLSRADRLLMDEVWEEHKDKTSSQLRKWTHLHCPEYDELSFTEWDPRKPIELDHLLMGIGFSGEEVAQLMESLAQQEHVDAQLRRAA